MSDRTNVELEPYLEGEKPPWLSVNGHPGGSEPTVAIWLHYGMMHAATQFGPDKARAFAAALNATADEVEGFQLICNCSPSPWAGYSRDIEGETCFVCRSDIQVAPVDHPENRGAQEA